ncbi:MAG: hypothetical protein JWO38_6130 [Gemmataceae bacterium]|nr:hypothetical protein [Gemmataceae bacterium]
MALGEVGPDPLTDDPLGVEVRQAAKKAKPGPVRDWLLGMSTAPRWSGPGVGRGSDR